MHTSTSMIKEPEAGGPLGSGAHLHNTSCHVSAFFITPKPGDRAPRALSGVVREAAGEDSFECCVDDVLRDAAA